ncbi:MAG: hypothetical protein HQ522_02380, partial [Bacteroidetes bacterium]|nr:hypothetical protein [Bacteroidota bacterium]
QYPENAKVIFLPTQAAKDSEILSKIEKSLEKGATLVFTSGFLTNAKNPEQLAELAGIKYPVEVDPGKANQIIVDDEKQEILHGLDFEAKLELNGGTALLNAIQNSKEIPFFVKSKAGNGNVYTVNSHTFSQADFDAVGEVLLCPKPLGLLEMPQVWANIFHNEINEELDFELNAPTRLVVQPLGESAWLFHNYNQTKQDFVFRKPDLSNADLINAFTGELIETTGDAIKLTLQPRSRIWIKNNTN